MPRPDPREYLIRIRDFLFKNKRNPFLYLAAACFIFQLGLTIFQCKNLVDDAYISARYARNFANGFGLVFNRGEAAARVEGYSNFLWVVLLALGWKGGFSMRFTAQFAGVLFSLFSSALLFFWVRKETGRKWLALACSGLLATNLHFAVWSVEGLETPLFSLLIMAVVYSLSLERKRLAMVMALLAALTRPDGILLFFAIALVQFLEFRRGLPQFVKTAGKWFYFIVPYFVYFLWRSVYYRSLLPNTFYAKTGLGWTGLREGALYYAQFAFKEQGILIAILVVLAGVLRGRRIPRPVMAAVVFAALYFLCIFFAGGDWMPHFRLIAPVFPVIYGAAFIVFHSAAGSGKLRSRAGLFPALFGLALLANAGQAASYYTVESQARTWHQKQARFYRPAADWLKVYVWQNQRIAVGDIGYIGYFGDHDFIIDTTGLTDKHLGRLPGISSLSADVDYVLGLKPFAIVRLAHKYPEGVEIGHSEFDRQVALDSRFIANYRLTKEIFAWQSDEKSRVDNKRRLSQVHFKVYLIDRQ